MRRYRSVRRPRPSVACWPYEQYLSETRGLATATILGYVPFVARVRSVSLRHRSSDPLESARWRCCGIRSTRAAPGMNRRRAKLMTTALRSFLHYVRYRDEGMPDLVAAVPVVANSSMDSVPRAISADQVRRLLIRIDRGTAIGRRDSCHIGAACAAGTSLERSRLSRTR